MPPFNHPYLALIANGMMAIASLLIIVVYVAYGIKSLFNIGDGADDNSPGDLRD